MLGLFFRTWINLGIDDSAKSLLGQHSSTLALFSEAALDATMRAAAAHFSAPNRYASTTCPVQFGLTPTHLNDNPVVLHEGTAGESQIEGVSQRERFALRLDFGGDASSFPRAQPRVRIRNMTWPPQGELIENDSALGSRFPRLGTSDVEDAEVPVETLFMAVRGSGAFPGAFPPVKLPFRRMRGAHVGDQEYATFIDGGVFDNTPLGLAIQLESARDSVACQVRGQPAEHCVEPPRALSHALVPLAPVSYVLVDPDAIGWHLGNEDEERPGEDADSSILKTYQRFVGRFIGSSRHAALVEASERWPFVTRNDRSGLGPSLLVPRRNLPIAGEQLNAFLAFLERDFRIFDFYVGMADAAAMLEEDPRLKEAGSSPVDDLVHSHKFTCLRDYYRERLNSKEPIEAEQLPQSCKALQDTSSGAVTTGSQNFRALLVAMHNYKLWTMRSARNAPGAEHFDPGYTQSGRFDAFFGALRAAEFQFNDLPKVIGQSDPIRSGNEARRAVRLLMQRAVNQLSVEQPTVMTGSTIRLVGRAVADQYDVLRPDLQLNVGLVTQGLEAGLGFRMIDALRLDVGLRAFHLDEVSLTRTDDVWRFDSAVSMTFTGIVPIIAPLDLEFGSGVVGTFTWATEKRALAAFRVGPRGSVAAALFRRFYLGFDFEYFPYVWMASDFDGSFAPIARKWRMSLAAGVRLFF